MLFSCFLKDIEKTIQCILVAVTCTIFALLTNCLIYWLFFFPVVGKVPVGGEVKLDNWIRFSP